MKRVSPILLLLLLGACAAERPAPLASGARPVQPNAATGVTGRVAAPPAQAAAKAGPERFDGTYKGVRTVLVAGGADCASRPAPRNLVVQDGAARVVWNPALGSAFAGSVAPDGALSMTLDQPPAPTVLTGSISGAQATGRTEGADCRYEMSWRKSR